MSSARVGLGAFQLGVEKLFDKIPEKAFSGDTYIPGRSNTKKSRSRRGSLAKSGAAAAGAAAGAEAADKSDHDRSRSRTKAQPRRSRDDAAQSYDYSNQGYYPDPSQVSQGDPKFSYTTGKPSRYDSYPLDQRDGPTDNSRGNVDDAFWNQQDRVESPVTMQQDPYYAPPPPGPVYHRYNPADYQPQAYSGGGNGYGSSRYQPGPYQEDPYARPASAGHADRYSDERRGRDKDKSRRRKKERSRSRSNSSSPGGIRGVMHKNLDTTERGLATGAIGAIAGGLAGHEFGKNALATVAGVLLGGLGANAWEAHESRHKSERKSDKSDRHRDRRSSRRSPSRTRSEGRRSSGYQRGSSQPRNDAYDYGGRNSIGGYGGGRDVAPYHGGYNNNGGGGGYDSDSGSMDSKGRTPHRRRKKEEKKQKRRERDERGELENANTWGQTVQ